MMVRLCSDRLPTRLHQNHNSPTSHNSATGGGTCHTSSLNRHRQAASQSTFNTAIYDISVHGAGCKYSRTNTCIDVEYI